MCSLPRGTAAATPTVEVAAAAADLDAVLARVAAGEEIVLAREGVPVARLVPQAAAGVDTAGGGQSEVPSADMPEKPDVVTRLKAFSRGRRLGLSVRELRETGRP